MNTRPSLSTEIRRRCFRTRIESPVERPEEREPIAAGGVLGALQQVALDEPAGALQLTIVMTKREERRRLVAPMVFMGVTALVGFVPLLAAKGEPGLADWRDEGEVSSVD